MTSLQPEPESFFTRLTNSIRDILPFGDSPDNDPGLVVETVHPLSSLMDSNSITDHLSISKIAEYMTSDTEDNNAVAQFIQGK